MVGKQIFFIEMEKNYDQSCDSVNYCRDNMMVNYVCQLTEMGILQIGKSQF